MSKVSFKKVMEMVQKHTFVLSLPGATLTHTTRNAPRPFLDPSKPHPATPPNSPLSPLSPPLLPPLSYPPLAYPPLSPLPLLTPPSLDTPLSPNLPPRIRSHKPPFNPPPP